jgi:beta-RFAP synthase
MIRSGVEVAAPSRLHFGMFSFGRTDTRQFGGVGLMVERPGLRLRIEAADHFDVLGPLGQRARSVVARLLEAWSLGEPPGCRIEILSAPPEHAGLGTGTQLALAVAAGLNAWRGGQPLDAERLARLTGRGERSAIGTHGFLQGGLLVEAGKLPGETLSPLERRLALPRDWRVVLIWPRMLRGLSGEAERRAFCELPPVPPETSHALRREVATEMVPAAELGDFERFSQSVYRFGVAAGQCFAPLQCGPFGSARIARLVEAIRASGVAGVGQSSWGPTVFALLADEAAAQRFCQAISEQLAPDETTVTTRISDVGARITQVADA